MDPDMPAAYTEKELTEIATWLKEGLSASHIAVRFSTLRGSPVSRNAIIGIVHRDTGLRAIGFANPKGGRSGGRPRTHARPDWRSRVAAGSIALSEPSALARQVESAHAEAANLPPSGGDARQGRGGRCPADVSSFDVASQADRVSAVRTPLRPKKPKPRKPARVLPPAWLAPGQRERSEAQLYKLPAPPPPVNPGRQPHVAAMRFIDCLFGRCRAALDLALQEEPEKDAPGARPGPEMLCCGLRTRPTQSYCSHHHARLHGHRGSGM
ncbi:MAG: GcrA cell cycle regulator [Mesorhizobium sp.]|nr:MAG: GcrA cell cycle regulator [Mesorhizobium sp.]